MTFEKYKVNDSEMNNNWLCRLNKIINMLIYNSMIKLCFTIKFFFKNKSFYNNSLD